MRSMDFLEILLFFFLPGKMWDHFLFLLHGRVCLVLSQGDRRIISEAQGEKHLHGFTSQECVVLLLPREKRLFERMPQQSETVQLKGMAKRAWLLRSFKNLVLSTQPLGLNFIIRHVRSTEVGTQPVKMQHIQVQRHCSIHSSLHLVM